MFGVFDKFGRAGVFPAADMTCKFDERHLHAEADAEEGNAMGSGVFDGDDFSFGASHAKAARHEDPLHG